MANESPGQTLQATALVHEAYLRLLGDDEAGRQWDNKGHFFAAAAEAMRRILIDRARAKGANKRGGGRARVSLSPEQITLDTVPQELLDLDEAISRLAEEDTSKADLVLFVGTLVKAWTRLDRPNKAIEVWREHVDALRKDIPADDARLANSLIRYGRALLKNDQPTDAEPVLREYLSVREKEVASAGWPQRALQEARGVLGECLTKLSQFTEAEALLVELADAMSEDFAASDSTADAIQRVVDLYEAWNLAEPGVGYDARAAEWRARLPALEEEHADDAGRADGVIEK